jgi:hypothetical protein
MRFLLRPSLLWWWAAERPVFAPPLLRLELLL